MERYDGDDRRKRKHDSLDDNRRYGSSRDGHDDRRRDRGRTEDSDRRRDDSRDRRDDSRSRRDYSRDRRDDSDQQSKRDEGVEVPELHAVCKARVHSIKPFGIFVRLEGFRCQGLVHISQVSNHEVSQRDDPDDVKVQALSAIYDHGEDLWVKIISIKRDEGGMKIGCSIKYVSQSDGKDLDPNHLQLQSNESSRPPRSTHLKTNQDAIYDVVCPRCGGRGHLKNECYSTPGSKAYELVPEEEEEEEMVPKAAETKGERERLPDSVSTVEEAKALIARLKAEKKEKKRGRRHKKRKRGSSTSPSR